MANSKQAGSSSRMTMEEYKQLSNLLKRASNENRLGEVMVFANLEDEATTQLQSYLHPGVSAKAKPKAKAPSQMGGRGFLPVTGSDGAMTDASKRRLEDDLASMAASEGWEDIEVLSSYADAERAMASHGYVAPETVGVPFPSEVTRADLPPIDVSWYPALTYDDLDSRYLVPPTLDSTARWGTTICICPKWRANEWTYEHMVRRALAGDKEMGKYLTWLKSTYSKVFLGKVQSLLGLIWLVFLEGSSLMIFCMPVMLMHLWKASHVPWRSDGTLDAATRFGLFHWWHFAISASGFLLEIVAMVFIAMCSFAFRSFWVLTSTRSLSFL